MPRIPGIGTYSTLYSQLEAVPEHITVVVVRNVLSAGMSCSDIDNALLKSNLQKVTSAGDELMDSLSTQESFKVTERIVACMTSLSVGVVIQLLLAREKKRPGPCRRQRTILLERALPISSMLCFPALKVGKNSPSSVLHANDADLRTH
ncbi:hypothetical protein J6590_013817 [Homalodisca vitripennis]|nr:hypothetical protein J6590_013817 [Homalodisca vitripennis]